VAVQFSPISAIEILESRGRPTVAAILADGGRVRPGVPSGASFGSRKATESHDHNDQRYTRLGMGRESAPIGAPSVPAPVCAGAEVYSARKSAWAGH
jgi:enolase